MGISYEYNIAIFSLSYLDKTLSQDIINKNYSNEVMFDYSEVCETDNSCFFVNTEEEYTPDKYQYTLMLYYIKNNKLYKRREHIGCLNIKTDKPIDKETLEELLEDLCKNETFKRNLFNKVTTQLLTVLY